MKLTATMFLPMYQTPNAKVKKQGNRKVVAVLGLPLRELDQDEIAPMHIATGMAKT